MQVRNLIEQLGGRRFLMSMGCGMACTVLVWFGRITPEVFQWTVVLTVGAYITGNTAQKVKDMESQRPTSANWPEPKP